MGKYKKPKFKDVKIGMVFKKKKFRRDFDGAVIQNYMKVTRIPYFEKKGDRKNIFYAIYVNPRNFSKKRLPSDREFAVWDFNYNREKMVRVR